MSQCISGPSSIPVGIVVTLCVPRELLWLSTGFVLAEEVQVHSELPAADTAGLPVPQRTATDAQSDPPGAFCPTHVFLPSKIQADGAVLVWQSLGDLYVWVSTPKCSLSQGDLPD